MRDAGDPLLPFLNVSALLDGSDLVFGNLESPFAPPEEEGNAGETLDESNTGWDGIIGGKSLVFAAPNKSVQALSRFNFRLVAMANNHALDQGEAGITHTIRRLSASNIQVAGAGGNLEEAWQARIVELKGRKIGFLAVSYASYNYGTDERNEYVARIEDLDLLRSRVRALKSQADYIVVCMHAGEEYTGKPGPAQIQFAHAAIDAGVNLVVGSHPHWLQPFERYKRGLIFYSLGNFIFDLDSSPATREGAAVRLFIGANDLVEVQAIPIEIENSCCPRLARPDEVPRALRRMGLTSTHVPLLRGAK
jgi:poly-gamma-glutamate synthesis protein (capsule biosynthesis protein)